MDLETFQSLPTDEVARLVREDGPKVCVFPVNGTRRWLMLEHPPERVDAFASEYLNVMVKRYIELVQLFFQHGVHTLLVPTFGPDLLERGEAYTQMMVEGLELLTTGQQFLDFYEAFKVRVGFYGDYHKFLEASPYAYLSDQFGNVISRTREYHQHRLFFGLFAHDATQAVGEIAIRFYREHGRGPCRREIVELYYGEYVEPVDLFIGFDRFSAFDMPLVATGSEDLYFTVSPSPYLTERQLRDILYDHLYARRGDPDYQSMSPDDLDYMRAFYRVNLEHTQGVGTRRGDIWYPWPGAVLPDAQA